MSSFKDNKNRVWEVEITVWHVRRVRSLAGVDLLALTEDGAKGLGELLGDVPKLVDVVFVLVKDQADAQGVTDEDFGRSLGGDSLEGLTTAFLEGLASFFQNPAQRKLLRDLIAAAEAVGNAALARAQKGLAGLDLDRLAAELARGGGGSSGTAPESAGSTPAPSASANSS
jgi:hypothetical protein